MKEARNKLFERTSRRTLEEYRTARNEAKNIYRRKKKLFEEKILHKFGRNENKKVLRKHS
jgi:hypothetical protein